MTIIDLWQPILGSAVALFIVSAVVWMAMPWHKKDYAKIAREDAAAEALIGLEPGTYSFPHCTNPNELKDPALAKKFEDGPVGFLTILPSGVPTMGAKLVLSFAYYLVVGTICAYMITRTLSVDADYLATFRIAGTTAFLAYGVATIQESIWFGRPWSLALKSLWDALIYAGVTGGIFGWLA